MNATLLPRGGFLSDFRAAARLLFAGKKGSEKGKNYEKKLKMYLKYQLCERAGTYSGMNF